MTTSDNEGTSIDSSGEIRPTRAAVLALAEVGWAGQSVMADVEDVSRGGIRLFRPGGLALSLGAFVQIDLRIPAEPALSLHAKVVRLEPEMVGFQFHELTSEQAVELDRLLEKHGQLRDRFGVR